jgi:hypothetical protein
MAGKKKQQKKQRKAAELVPVQPMQELTLVPPDAGVVGKFLNDTQNMFKARAMSMRATLARINESGERTEDLLKMAAERMEAAEASLEKDLVKQGLVAQPEESEENPEALDLY